MWDGLRLKSSKEINTKMSALIKSTQDATTKELKDEIKILRGKVDAGVDNLGSQSADTTTR